MEAAKRKKAKKVAVIAFATIAILTITDYFTFPLTTVGGRSFNKGQNGLWLRYTWYFGQYKPVELTALETRLKDEQIRYAYFHVRYAEATGALHFHFEKQAKTLTHAIHEKDPNTKAIAWIFVGKQHGMGGVDLSKPEVRAKLIEEANWLVNTCGFDGVQWDYEICPDSDQGFLKLLEETKERLPKSLLGVATPVWMPKPFDRFTWSTPYFANIARRCDQIAVMTYDTGAYLPRAYTWLVRKQLTQLEPIVEKTNCHLIIGLPTYEDGTASHNPRAENLRLALKGVREANARTNNIDGIALFADYTTSPDEWKTYDSLWLN